jgi:hypothetical protein
MVNYCYSIVRVDDDRAIQIELEYPLPHLDAGNSLVVTNRHLRLAAGCHFVIRHVETTIEAPAPPAARVLRSTVYVEQCDRGRSRQLTIQSQPGIARSTPFSRPLDTPIEAQGSCRPVFELEPASQSKSGA